MLYQIIYRNAIAQIVVGVYGGAWASALCSADQQFVATSSFSKGVKAGTITFIASKAASTVGGISASLQGGNFRHGFWRAGIAA